MFVWNNESGPVAAAHSEDPVRWQTAFGAVLDRIESRVAQDVGAEQCDTEDEPAAQVVKQVPFRRRRQPVLPRSVAATAACSPAMYCASEAPITMVRGGHLRGPNVIAGTPEHALDCACGLYLGDVTAWI